MFFSDELGPLDHQFTSSKRFEMAAALS